MLLATEPRDANIYTPLLMKCVRVCVLAQREVPFSIEWHQFVLDAVMSVHSVTVAMVICFVYVCVCEGDEGKEQMEPTQLQIVFLCVYEKL